MLNLNLAVLLRPALCQSISLPVTYQREWKANLPGLNVFQWRQCLWGERYNSMNHFATRRLTV